MSFGVTETNSDLGWRFWTLITLRMKWLIHFLVWKISSTELNSCCFLLLDNCNILTVWQKSAKIRRCKAPVRVQTISHMCVYTDIHTDMKSPKSQAYTASLCLNHSLGVLSQTPYYETTTKENWRPKLKKVGETMRPFRYGLNQIPYDYTVEVRNSPHPCGGLWVCGNFSGLPSGSTVLCPKIFYKIFVKLKVF